MVRIGASSVTGSDGYQLIDTIWPVLWSIRERARPSPNTPSSPPAKAGDPGRRASSISLPASLEYWIIRFRG
jgi:hypothetical protein